ncbi:MAG: sigma-70 family RNA polymerase sigma factor [Planctomycetes bacterium]|nr:sigma-70 family RNA polymerase sigma factor [Planctomycetota bacterium]
MAACVRRVGDGDQDAAQALVVHTRALVLKLVRAHRAATHSDDDLLQEVYLTMFARLHRYEARAQVPFEHWLARLAVNVCRDALRAERSRPRLQSLSPAAADQLAALQDGARRPADDAEAAREAVDALLGRLAPDDRLVLTLLDLEQRSVAEISALTGWSRPLVKVRAIRARLRLRALVGREPRP